MKLLIVMIMLPFFYILQSQIIIHTTDSLLSPCDLLTLRENDLKNDQAWQPQASGIADLSFAQQWENQQLKIQTATELQSLKIEKLITCSIH